jgi:hypothetical protein
MVPNGVAHRTPLPCSPPAHALSLCTRPPAKFLLSFPTRTSLPPCVYIYIYLYVYLPLSLSFSLSFLALATPFDCCMWRVVVAFLDGIIIDLQ